tara:strand:+ start:384 stop:1724 length:1341 start_codon:yes stop_codon:yes gene_type:complete
MIKDHTEGYYWQDDYYPDINHVYKSKDYKYDIDVRLIDGCGDLVAPQRLEKSAEVLKEFEDKLPFRSFAIVSPFVPPHPCKEHNWIQLRGTMDYHDYGEFVLKYLHKYFDAKHVLLIQWDCFITNIDKWKDEFLDYDLVYTISDGFQKDDSEFIEDIGHFNGGLTLRSKKFCESTSDYFTNTKSKKGIIYRFDETSGMVYKQNEDLLIHENYEELKKYDLKFASPSLTSEFSLGNHTKSILPHRKQTAFGFHDMDMKFQIVENDNGEPIIMRYKDELNRSMKWLSDKEDTIFMGQSVKYSGNSIYGTLQDIDDEKRLELPVFEEIQMGMSTGMALNGHVPISCFPRMDFLLRCMDSLVNHLDKIQNMSNGQMKPKVIIRTAIGSREPLNGGVQHTQNYIEELKSMLTEVEVVVLDKTEDIFNEFVMAYDRDGSTILIEYGDYYNDR